jgi:threonine dehydrogenase-like Zn-dependent dehydrogenase
MKEAMNLLDEKRIETKSLVYRFAFSRIDEAFESLQRRDHGIIKGVIKVGKLS